MASYTVVHKASMEVVRVRRNGVLISQSDNLNDLTWSGKQDILCDIISRTVRCMNEGDSIAVSVRLPKFEDEF